jgi:hypothetical protein
VRGNDNRLKMECIIAKERLKTEEHRAESQFIQNLTGVQMLRHCTGHAVSERRVSALSLSLSLSLSEVN